jgi:hypothetical protein
LRESAVTTGVTTIRRAPNTIYDSMSGLKIQVAFGLRPPAGSDQSAERVGSIAGFVADRLGSADGFADGAGLVPC